MTSFFLLLFWALACAIYEDVRLQKLRLDEECRMHETRESMCTMNLKKTQRGTEPVKEKW